MRNLLNLLITFAWLLAFQTLGWITFTTTAPLWLSLLLITLVIWTVQILMFIVLGVLTVVMANRFPILALGIVGFLLITLGWYGLVGAAAFTQMYTVNVNFWFTGLIMSLLFSFARIHSPTNSSTSRSTRSYIPSWSSGSSSPGSRSYSSPRSSYSRPSIIDVAGAQVHTMQPKPGDTCHQCGAEKVPGRPNCGRCGAYLGEQRSNVPAVRSSASKPTIALKPASPVVRCNRCNSALPEDARFCNECGYDNGVTGTTTVL